MRGAPADERAPLVRQPLEAQRPRHHVAVRLDQREHRRRAQQVRRGQEVDVQNVGVEVLGVLDQLAELPALLVTSMPSAFSVALREARVWPMEQMPQMRLVMRATSV